MVSFIARNRSAKFASNRKPSVRRRNWQALASLLAGFCVMTASSAQADSPLGWLELKPVPGRNMVQITGHALALEPVSAADFTLSIKRRNGGNNSNTAQSGHFDLAPGEAKVLSSTSINVEAGDELTIELKIADHGREVFSATLSSHPTRGGQTL